MMDIIIYQINLSRDDDRVAYLGLSQLDKFQGSSEVNSGIYDKVFEGAVEVDTLEGVYHMVRGLADYRNDAIRDGKPTDDIDDLLLKVIDAPPKRKRGLWRNEAR